MSLRFGWKQDQYNDDIPLDILGEEAQGDYALDRFLKRELPGVIETLEEFMTDYEAMLTHCDVRLDTDETWCAITEVLRLR